MHRHGYKGRKFGREKDQRRALIKSLADSLIIYESIETTLPKAKELIPYMEKLVTKAKKGGLAERRLIIASVHTKPAANKLVDELAPKLKSRHSGHFTIARTSLRRGDNAQMAKISFILDKKTQPAKKPTDQKTETVPKKVDTPKEVEEKTTQAPATKTEAKPASKISAKTSFKNIAKRTGIRGNR